MDQASSKSNSGDKSQKRPWSWIWMLPTSVLSGSPGSYLIVWQNLKRIGREDIAKKFVIVGGIILLTVTAVLFLLPISRPIRQWLGTGLSIIFPLWFYSNYLKEWQKQNPKVAGFSWALVGWGFLGLMLYLALVFLVAFLFPDPSGN